jgi:PAS domain S-box-containing protein
VARAIEDMAEQAHRLRFQSEALLRRNQTLMKNSMDGIHVLDIRGDIVEANDAFCRMLGYTQEEMAGLNLADVDAQWAAEELQARIQAFIGESAQFETVHRRKDGSLINVEVSINGMEIDGQCFLLASSHDITHRKHAEQAQRDADRRKDEFLAMLAHELRNPLVPIRNAAHIIGRLGLDEPRIKWAQELIEGQVSHLARMVDDLLDVSRIAQGKITLLREEVELGALVGRLMQSIGPLAEGKGLSLVLNLPDRPICLQGDSVRLSQVLFNLVDNAVKYTPEGGRIELAARMEGPEVEISVRDNGMGIAAELLPRVFDLFQQDERTLDRAKGGLGIGLTLVQRLVAMHGGRVEAHSAGAGQGSTFTVWLPAQAMPERPAAPDRNKHTPAVGMRVMVVDDDPAVSDSTAMLLELEGHTMCIADTGQSALEQMPAFRPQVVLLDIGMKDMDGFEIVKRLRALPEGRDLCVVAVTGYADEKTRTQALASGFTYFMVKPVSFELFRDLLARESGMARNPA